MDKERITQLIARKLSGEASPAELQELEALLQEYPKDAYFLSVMDDYWTTPVFSSASEQEDPEAHFRQILHRAADRTPGTEEKQGPVSPPPGRPGSIRTLLAIAAVISGLIVCAWLWQYNKKDQGQPDTATSSFTATIANPGARSRILLPDGTVVWLNSDSRLRYPKNFADSSREVELEGEAYFDVTKQAASPFIVHTRDLHVEVLGTAFNVKSYPNDDRTEATLIRGLVQVRRTGDSREKALLLHPHEKVVVNRSADNQEDQPLKPITVQQLKHNLADTSLVETAWVYNKLVFDGEDFRDIANEMERWYNVKISITDPAIARYRFHAKFENETIAEVLAALQASRPFTFKINNHEINIYK